jgi:tripeptide aminopeptidase
MSAHDDPIERARAVIRQTDEQTVADMVAVTQVPAPPFHEDARAKWLAARFADAGLDPLGRDAEGNVLARLPGRDDALPPVLVAAHLDTVFPSGTDVTVREEAGRLAAPGISDNGRGLAAVLALVRALREARLRTEHPVVFVGSVGEEGLGDLRGVKHLFREGSPWRDCAAFIAVDGTGMRRIVHRALGSRRLRIELTGPGGHSWADWGTANPAHALGIAAAELARLRLPRQPRTTCTVARLGGGTSVNAIPADAWLELDMRSEAAGPLADVEAAARAAIQRALGEVNARRRRGTPALQARIIVIGDRPSGQTPVSSALVRAAQAATRRLGEMPELVASSTDANVAISLGIPAIAIGAGGDSGGMHTLGEWYSNEKGAAGVERVLLILLAVAGAAPVSDR